MADKELCKKIKTLDKQCREYMEDPVSRSSRVFGHSCVNTSKHSSSIAIVLSLSGSLGWYL